MIEITESDLSTIKAFYKTVRYGGEAPPKNLLTKVSEMIQKIDKPKKQKRLVQNHKSWHLLTQGEKEFALRVENTTSRQVKAYHAFPHFDLDNTSALWENPEKYGIIENCGSFKWKVVTW